MIGTKYAGLLAALILSPAMVCASEEGSIILKNLPVQEKLESRVDVNFQGTTLSEVLQFFRQTLGINMVLDSSASALADKPISLQLKDVRAQDALTWALRQVGLRYALVSGIVFVGDRQYVNSMEPRSLRQYDVSDLLMIPELTVVTNGNTNSFNSTPNSNGAQTSLNINKSSTGRAVVTAADLTNGVAASTVRRNPAQIASLGSLGNLSIRKELKESSF
jgi:type II secretory pathway component GspD/PulD (secretin)